MDPNLKAGLISAPIIALYAFARWKIGGGWNSPSRARLRLMKQISGHPGREEDFLLQLDALDREEMAILESRAGSSWVARRRLMARLESDMESWTKVRQTLENLSSSSDELARVDRTISDIRRRIEHYRCL